MTDRSRRRWRDLPLILLGAGLAVFSAAQAAEPASSAASHPPIAVPFDLPAPGYVTLVIEDESGRRVRNLVSAQYYPAGQQTAWWDGTDDLGRDVDAAEHGYYHIPAALVAPGTYRVRGLSYRDINLRYQFSVYSSGMPPWQTVDGGGGWLADHYPPMSALFLPAGATPGGKPLVYIGSYVAEAGQGLAWVDLEGRKQGGERWVGGSWTGAAYLARDRGRRRLPDLLAFAATFFRGELRITGLTGGADKPILASPLKLAVPSNIFEVEDTTVLHGLAAYDGILAVSVSPLDELLFVAAGTGAVFGHAPIADPRGLAFDQAGRLLVLSGRQLLRCVLPPFPAAAATASEAAPELAVACSPLTSEPFEDPQGLALDEDGDIYVSDWGNSHQVKILSADGERKGAIGHPGAPREGAYDESHMNHPFGLAIDEHRHLWVAEKDGQPKRVSVWSLDGRLWKAFYGPPQYGGGGALDPLDKTRFYYAGMEFRLDWAAGASRPVDILYRLDATPARLPVARNLNDFTGLPETPIYCNGRQYMSNQFDADGTNGAPIVTLWIMRGGVAAPVAALGRLSGWPELPLEEIRSRLPGGIKFADPRWRDHVMLVWSDLNGDGHVQADELQFADSDAGGITMMPDLSFIASAVGDRSVRYRPSGFVGDGVSVYDLAAGETLVAGAQAAHSDGGDQLLVAPDGWVVMTTAPKPFARQSLGGARNGTPLWSYPSLWPGLHPSHSAPVPDRPGELIGTTRLLGGFVTPRGSDAGSLWAINGNQGVIYLFTHDGLFVAQLFRDGRRGTPWTMPVAERDMPLNKVSLHGEDFWPTITQTADGNIYLQVGFSSSLVRVDGLETIRRLPETTISLTPEALRQADDYVVASELGRQQSLGRQSLTVSLLDAPPRIDGTLDDWAQAHWAEVDRSGSAAYFDSPSKPYDVEAALAVAGDRLYAAFRTGDPTLLRNSGQVPTAPFVTGGALDLMIGSDPGADGARKQPAAGDERLLVTKVKGRLLALLYRAVVPGTATPVSFSSPWRTVTFDQVEDVSDQIEFAEAGGNYEFSVPLATLDLKPGAGTAIRGDIGLLRGNGFQTLQRSYWNNKATALVSDVPDEAELVPALWGSWLFKR